MISLPPPHRAYIKAFWIIMTLMVTGMMFAGSMVFDTLWGFALGIGLGCVGLAYGLMEINMKVMWIAYRAWNKLAELVIQTLQTIVVAISFFIMFVCVGKLGSSLLMSPPKANQTLWIRRESMPLYAYDSQSSFSNPSKKDSHWGRFFVDWATKSGKYWVWFLVPFFYILSLLDTEQSEDAPAGNYTLF